MRNDLSVDGSLQGEGDLGQVDWACVPIPKPGRTALLVINSVTAPRGRLTAT